MTTAKRLAKTTTILMIISLISKVLGFARESIIAYYFGGGMEAEAYFMANSVPGLIFATLSASISTTFIPMYTNLLIKDGRDDANRFANNIINIIGILSCVLLILGLVLSPRLVSLLAPGFSGELYDLTTQLTRILFIGSVFSMIASILTGILRSNDKFYGPAMTGFVINFIVISGTVLFSGKYGIYALTVASLLATILQTFMMMALVRDRYTYKPIVDFSDPLIKKLLLLIVPVLIGSGISQINRIVDKALASNLELGSISAINYSSRLVGFVDGIFTSTVMIVIYPFFSQMSARENYKDLNSYISRSINMFTMVMIPITMITIFYSTDIVTIVFKRGEFGAKDVSLTSFSLIFLAIGFLPYATRQVFNRAFYSMQDTKTSMINGAVAVTTNVVVDFMLIKSLRVGGLSLATSISYIASNIFYILAWRRAMNCSIKDILDFKTLGKLSISFVLFTALIWFLHARGVHLFIATFIGGVIYVGLLWKTGIEELKIFATYMKKRFSFR